jgi:hypothetical protein
MAWYRLAVQSECPSKLDPGEALYELVDDTTEMLGVTVRGGPETEGRRHVEVELAIEADDRDAAQAHVRALFEADRDLKLVALGEITETTNPRALSSRAHDILRDAADELRDELREDIQALRDGAAYEETFAVRQHLPAGFARHYTPDLVAQWAGSVETVAHKFAGYPDTYLATSAEELAGHALIERCEELIEERAGQLDDPDALREKFSEVHDLAFEDHDVLMLFDASLDGIEDDPVGEMLGVANLHPREWFTPFRSED